MAVNGAMLRLARQLRGFHQTTAAEKLKIDQPILSRMENGLMEIRDDMLIRAAEIYDVPTSFFLLNEPVYGAPVSVHPMWRRKADVSARELDSVVAELNVRAFQMRRLLEAAEVINSADLPKLDVNEYDDPEEIAAIVRAHWKVPHGPIRDLTLLVERAGIFVIHSSLADTNISGVTFSIPGMPPIVMLNKNQPADRLRYSLAHELGHLVMHRLPSVTMEDEANAFAAALLMPEEDIRHSFVGRKIDLSILAALKPEWRVSMAALLMRARDLGSVSQNQAQYLWKQFNIRKIRMREPPELDFEPEKPTVLATILRLHLDSLGFSLNDLSKILHLHEEEIAAMYPIEISEPQNQRPKLTILK